MAQGCSILPESFLRTNKKKKRGGGDQRRKGTRKKKDKIFVQYRTYLQQVHELNESPLQGQLLSFSVWDDVAVSRYTVS